MHFCQTRKMHNQPTLTLNGSEIPITHQNKFLGITLDPKLSFIRHIKQLRIKCNQTIQLLRTIAHTDWGADKKKTLTKLYRCLIRSKLDYGCFIYGTARKSYLRELKTIHHLGLRIALGAFTTSLIESLYIEVNEAPLSLRRYKLTLQYYIKLISCPQNPAYNCIIETRYKNLFENKEKVIKPFNLRIQTLLNKINPKIIHNTILPKTAPWTINQPIIKLDLTKLSKTKTHPITFQENFLNIQNNFPNHHHIYTDGSKQEMKVGCVAIFQNQELLKRLPSESSIYSAEVIAIDLVMNIIANHKSSKFIIYSDSKSVLQAPQNKDSLTPLITRLLDKMNTLSKNNSIILTWIPSHIGIQGNERADRAAEKHSRHVYPIQKFYTST